MNLKRFLDELTLTVSVETQNTDNTTRKRAKFSTKIILETVVTSESQNVEFKVTWKDEYLKWIYGFANAYGGTIVFWVNRTERLVLYSILDSIEVHPSFSNGRNLINDLGYDVSATAKDATQFETFYRFKIIEKAPMPDGWNYSNLVPFNGQTMAIVLYEPNANEPEKKIDKINDIIPVFIKEEVTEILNEALALLSNN